MTTVRLEIDLSRITLNTRKIIEIASQSGLEIVGVTKGVCGLPPVAKAMLEGGLRILGDARLDNIERMRKADIRHPILLLRSPALSEVQRCIQLADGSLNADPHVLQALSEEAINLGKSHEIILMVDLETGREGLLPEMLPEVSRMVQALKGLKLRGLGIYFSYQSDPQIHISKQKRLVSVARDVEQITGIPLPIVSGGSTNAFSSTTLKGLVIPGVTQLRIGTTILLGISSSKGPKRIEGFHQDTCVLSAEIIEIKRQNGLIGILSLGKVDTDPEYIFPIKPGVSVIDASCDHMVVNLGQLSTSPKIGDRICFQLGYYALNRLMVSPYTRIEYRSSDRIASAGVEKPNG